MIDTLTIDGINEIVTHPLEIEILPSVDSTNEYLKRLAKESQLENKVVIALKQTQGKGRQGKHFYSPDESGLYLSLLIRPTNLSLNSATKITTMAALAACKAIESVTHRQALIKWVNDIIIDNKKVAGILTEASLDIETKQIDYLVLGIGFNVTPPKGGFPQEISDIAGSILKDSQPNTKNELAGQFLNEFLHLFHNPVSFSYQDYKKRSYVLGKEIVVHTKQKCLEAVALDLDEDCHLIVEYRDKTKEVLSSGEISIRRLS